MGLRSDACSCTTVGASDKADVKLAKKSKGDPEEGIGHKTAQAFLLRKPEKTFCELCQ